MLLRHPPSPAIIFEVCGFVLTVWAVVTYLDRAGAAIKSLDDPRGIHRLRLRPVPVPGLQQKEIANRHE